MSDWKRIELKIDSADLLGKFKCPSRYFVLLLPPGRMTRIFFRLLRRPRFYFVRGEGAALYYGLRKAFRRQIAEYFGECSDRKSIRPAGRDGGENAEWGRIARILGYRSYRPAFSFSLLYHSLPLSLSSSHFPNSIGIAIGGAARTELRKIARHDKSRYPTRYHLASTSDGWQILSRSLNRSRYFICYTQ